MVLMVFLISLGLFRCGLGEFPDLLATTAKPFA